MNNFMTEVTKSLNLSDSEMMKEKYGYYEMNDYQTITKDIPGLQNIMRDILGQLGRPDGFWDRTDGYYNTYDPFEGMGKDYFQWDATDGTDWGSWWNIPVCLCKKICDLFQIKYNENTVVKLYGCDYGKTLQIEIYVTYYNKRHPEWKKAVTYTASCPYEM